MVRAPASETEWQAYYQFRWQQLRAPWQQPFGSEKDELEDKAFHRLVINNGKVVAVGRIHQADEQTAQIRYMAVDTACQRQGLGSVILTSLEQVARQKNLQRVILHARENAVAFYEKSGYRCVAPSHTLYNEIKHFLMEKFL